MFDVVRYECGQTLISHILIISLDLDGPVDTVAAGAACQLHIVIIRSKLFPRWSCCGTWARDQRVPGQVNTTPHFLVQIWGELELTLNYTSTWILDTAQIQLEYFHIMLYEQISSHLFSPMRWQFNASFSWPLPWHVKSWNARTVSRCVSEKTNHKRNEWRWMVWKQDLGIHS